MPITDCISVSRGNITLKRDPANNPTTPPPTAKSTWPILESGLIKTPSRLLIKKYSAVTLLALGETVVKTSSELLKNLGLSMKIS